MNEQLKVIISAEVSKFKKGINEAKGALGTFKSEVSKGKEEINKAWTAIGEASTKAAKTIIAGVAAIAGALIAANASTVDFRQNQAQLSAAYEQAGISAKGAADAHAHLYKVIGDDDQATESAVNIALLASNEQEAARWAETCSGVMATFHDTLQPEAFYEAANETLKLGEATGAYAQMLDQTGIMTVEEFNKKLSECSTEAEKQAFMLEVTEQATGKAGEAFDEATAKIQAQRDAQLEFQKALAGIGDAVAPLITSFMSFASDALGAVTPHIQSLAEVYGPQLKGILEGIGQALEPIANFIANNLPLIATIAGIIIGISTAYNLVNSALAVYNTITAAHTAVTTIATAAQTAFATVTWATVAPILAVIAVIAAIIAIIVILIKHWDEISATVEKVANAIKEKVSEMAEKVKAKFEEMKAKVTEKINALKQAAVDKFNQLKQGIQDKIQQAKDKVSSTIEGMKSAAVSKVSGMVSSVKGKFDEIKSGIQEKINGARDAVKSAIDKIKSFFNFSWSLPKLKMPHISITGSFSINPPSAPHFSISWYELGGIFDSPHLFPWAGGIGGLGENGAEAIVPLEKNTKWLDRIADMLANKQRLNPIIMTVDGKTFAQISVESINELTRQTGNLPLKLA